MVAQHPYSTWDLAVITTGSPALSCDADATQTHMAEMDRLDLAVLRGGGAQLAATERANVDRVRDALG